MLNSTDLMELKVGDRAKILDVCSDCDSYQQKLLAMGLFPGVDFTVIKVAPLGDPILLQTRFGQICIRKKEAYSLKLMRLGDPG